MGMRRSQEHGMSRTGEMDIISVLSPTCQKPIILNPSYGLSCTEFHVSPLGCPGAGLWSVNRQSGGARPA
jgi:hypothetical protein